MVEEVGLMPVDLVIMEEGIEEVVDVQEQDELFCIVLIIVVEEGNGGGAMRFWTTFLLFLLIF